jgi:hypothetical protein
MDSKKHKEGLVGCDWSKFYRSEWKVVKWIRLIQDMDKHGGLL